MAGSEEAVGGGSETEVDTQAGGTTGANADMGMGGGGEVGLGVSGAQTGSVSGAGDSMSDSGVSTDFPKAEPLAAKGEGEDPGAKTDFLPNPDEDYPGTEDES
jgi:hypothetical protein